MKNKDMYKSSTVADGSLISAEQKLYKNAYEVMENLKIHLLPKYQIVSINRREIEVMVELLSSALSESKGEIDRVCGGVQNVG